MLFNSSAYLLFLIAVLLLYSLIRQNVARQWILLLASATFYMYFVPEYILILIVVILIDYSTAIQIESVKNLRYKKIWLIISILSNVCILFYFKYYNFFIETINTLTPAEFTTLSIILPIGLSFHTFQSLSYVAEIYYGKFRAERNLLIFALYVLFFPQLVAGPIERPQNVLPQLRILNNLSFSNLIVGCRHIAIGLLMKSVIADRLSLYVADVFDGSLTNTVESATGILFFSFQILCDFSGYSLVALGSAKLFGISLMRNFDKPYLSKSIREFWNRWHISLSSWFRDYVYIPFGGKAVSKFTFFRNIMIVFALSGLWHGADWKFVVWGLIHGLLVFSSHSYKWSFSSFAPSLKILDILVNFTIVSLLWTFFRASNLEHTIEMFSRIQLNKDFWNYPLGRSKYFGSLSVTIVIIVTLYLFAESRIYLILAKKKKELAQVLMIVFSFVLLLALGIFQKQTFIYFQF